jgi:hypothetical protein
VAKRRQTGGTPIGEVPFLDTLLNSVGAFVFLLLIAILFMQWIAFRPKIHTESLHIPIGGRPYNEWLSGREGAGRFRWSMVKGNLPDGVRLDPDTGRLSGTFPPPPDGKIQTYEFTVRFEHFGGATSPLYDEKKLTVDVLPERLPLRILTENKLPDALQENPYPLVFSAVGGTAPYRWTLVGGQMPQGLTLSSDGVITGEPLTRGDFRANIQVSTATGEQAQKAVQMTVRKFVDPGEPEILTKEAPEAIAGRPYVLYASARGGLPPYTWRIVGGPEWLKLTDPKLGRFEGTPSVPDSIGAELALALLDMSKHAATSQPISIKVFEPGVPYEPPKIVTDVLPDPVATRQYAVVASVQGGSRPFKWELLESPGWLRVENPSTGRIGGEPGLRDVSDGTVRLAVTDGAGGRVESTSLNLSVLPPTRPAEPLELATAEVPATNVAARYFLALAYRGGVPPYSWELAWTEQPAAGLNLDAKSGIVSGSPQSQGKFPLAVRLVDAIGNECKQVLDVSVNPEIKTLEVASDSLPPANVGGDYRVALAAWGGYAPYAWSLERGELPPGLELTPAGTIAGTPTKQGKWKIDVAVVDARTSGTPAGAAKSLELDVNPEIKPLEILSRGLAWGNVGTAFDTTLAASGGYPPYSWQIADGELPPGLRLLSSGRIEGVPGRMGRWNVGFAVRDAKATPAKEPLLAELTVFDLLEMEGVPRQELSVVTESLPTLLVGRPAECALASKGAIYPVSWKIVGKLPVGLTLSGETGTVWGAPSTPGERLTRVALTDALDRTAFANVRINAVRVAPHWVKTLAIVLAALVALALLLAWLLRRRIRRMLSASELSILTKEIPSARASVRYMVQLACQGGTPPYRWKLAGGALPSGMELTPEGAVQGVPFEGTPLDAARDFPFTAEVTDQAGQTAKQEL